MRRIITYLFLLVSAIFVNNSLLQAQTAPAISYGLTGTQVFATNSAITPMALSNTGGVVSGVYRQVSNFAGSGGAGSTDGTGTSATFNDLRQIAINSSGDLFVADANNNRIRKITASGVVTTFAGSGVASSTDGQGTAATLKNPMGIAINQQGDIFVAEANGNKIRKITAAGYVSTFAGTGTAGSSDNAIGTSATFSYPWGLCFDASGNLFVAETGSGKVRKITPSGAVSTYGASQAYSGIRGMAFDNSGNLYVNCYNDRKIYKITPSEAVSVFVGGTNGDLDGNGTSVKTGSLGYMQLGNDNYIYFTDVDNNKVKKMSLSADVTTIVGGTLLDGSGSSTAIVYPYGFVFDGKGNAFTTIYSGNVIKKISLQGYFISPALPAGLTLNTTNGTISGTPTSTTAATTYTITAYNTAGSSATTIVLATAPANTIALSSATGTNAQSKCINTPITNITYNTANATGATFSGLPAGVTGTWANNIVTISGTPSVAGAFNYTVTLTGGAGSVTATGSITVNALPTITGTLSICAGATSQLVGSATAATVTPWVSANTAVATVSTTGLVTALSSGSSLITYTNSNGCVITATVTVKATPTLTSSTGTNEVNKTGLVAYLDAGNTSSYPGTGNMWNDLSGNGNNFTLSNTYSFNSANKGSLLFNVGQAQSQNVALDLKKGYTLVQVMKLANYNGGTFQYNNGNKYINFYMGGQNRMRWETYAGNAVWSNGTIPLNTWVVVVGTFSGVSNDNDLGTAKIYINGALDITTSLRSSASMPAVPMIIGQYAGWMNGAIGTTLFYNRELSLDEIKTTYSAFNARYDLLNLVGASSSSSSSATATTSTLVACSGINYNYKPTSEIAGATFSWSRDAVTGISNAAATGTGEVNEVLNNTTSSAVVVKYVYTTTFDGCSSTKNVFVMVNPTNTASAGTAAGAVCVNTALTSITHTTTGATGIGTATGLPAGVTAAFDVVTNKITISGKPTASGTFNYSIPLTGGCGAVNATGTITVNTLPTVSVSPDNITTKGICVGESITLTASGANTYSWMAGTKVPLDELTTYKLAVGLRKLRTGYTGAALRLRRSTDNVEADFGFNQSDLDVAAIATWLGNATGYCVKLYDQSGNGNDMVPSSVTNQPTYVANGGTSFNNKPVLRFTTNQNIKNYTNFPAPFTALIAAQRATGNNGRILTSVYNNWLMGWWSNLRASAYYEGWVSYNNAGATDNNPYVYTGTATGGGVSSLYENGVIKTTNVGGGNTGPNGISINHNEPSEVNLAEIMLFNTVLADADRATLEKNSGSYYGIFGTAASSSLPPTVGASITVKPTATATYTLTATAANGCAVTSNPVVTVSAIPVVSANVVGSAAGYSGNALQLDGSNDQVVLPKIITNSFTLEYWVKSTQASPSGSQWYNGNGIVDAEYGGVTTDFGTSLLNNKVAFGVGNSDKTIFSTTSINTGTWNHVAASWNGATGAMSLYINGILEASATGGPTGDRTAVARIVIGSLQTNNQFFNGTIDELKIWNTVRTVDEIKAGMNSALLGTETGLGAYYNFNQGVASGANASITTLIDNSNKGKNGTLYNFTLSGASSNWIESNSGTVATTASICAGNTLQLNNSTAGGAWSSSDITIATVDSKGLVKGITGGTATISYKITNASNCAAVSTTAVTVNDFKAPTLAIASNSTSLVAGSLMSFTATPTNGGVTPSYQWKRNGVNVGTNSATFSSSSLLNNDVITCVLTSTSQCATSSTGTSNAITVNITFTPGNGLALDGVDDYAQAAPGVYFNGNFTVEAWVYPKTGFPNWARIIDFGNGAGNNCVLLGYTYGTSGYPGFYVGGAQFQANTPLKLDQWNHVAATLNGTLATIYVNGVAAGTATFPVPANVVRNNCYIGKSNWGDPYMKGIIDELRIWNVARTADQIKAAMNVEMAGNENGLVAYYPFNQGTPSGDNKLILNAVDASTTAAGTATLYNFDLSNGNSTSNFIATNKVLTTAGLPVIASFSPTIAWKGATITIKGSNLLTATAVSIGGVAANSFTVVDDGTITAVVGNTAVSGNVSIVTPYGSASASGFVLCNQVTPTISIAPSINNICSGAPVTFTATAVFGTGIPTYQWKKNGSNVGTNSATYADAALNNGDKITCSISTTDPCATSASATSAETVMIVRANPVITTQNITNACAVSSADLSKAITSSTTGISFAYSISGSATNAIVTTPGTYVATATNSVGCTAASAITVGAFKPLPIVTTNMIVPVCGASSANLSLQGIASNPSVAALSYYSDAGLTAQLSTTDVKVGGTYYVKATSDAGCTSTASIVVNVFKPNPVINTIAYNPTCGVASANLFNYIQSSTTGLTLGYYSDAALTTPVSSTVTAGGTYYAAVTAANGCVVSASIAIGTFKPKPVIATTPIFNACGATVANLATGITSSTLGLTVDYFSDNLMTVPTQSSVTVPGTYYTKVTAANGCSVSDNIVVNNFKVYPTLATKSITAACGVTQVNLINEGITSSVNNLTTTLYSDQAMATIVPSPIVTLARTYYAKVVNTDNCAATASIVVNPFRSNPVVTTNPIYSVCGGPTSIDLNSTITSNADGLTAAYYSNAALTQSIGSSVTAGGNYYVKMTSTNGCSSSAAIWLQAFKVTPTVTTKLLNPTCGQVSVSLFDAITSSTSGLNVAYYANADLTTTTGISKNISGTYYVQVKNNDNCTATASIEVAAFKPNPILNTQTVFPACGALQADLFTGVSSNVSNIVFYKEAQLSTAINNMVEKEGTYYAKATSTQGCTAQASVYVSSFIGVKADPIKTVCNSNSSDLSKAITSSTAGLTVAYYADATFKMPVEKVVNLLPSAQTFYVRVSNGGNCFASAKIPVEEIKNNPSVPVLYTYGKSIFCVGDSIILKSPDATSYLWNTGATTANLKLKESGDYSVTVANYYGCTSQSPVMHITVNSNVPPPIIRASGTTTICDGSSVVLTASTNSSYLWSNGATTPSITVKAGGDYIVNGWDANGCLGVSLPTSVTIKSVPAIPVVAASGPLTYCNEGSVTLTAPAATAYAWSNGATTPSITVNTTGSYAVTVQGSNGCTTASAATSFRVNTRILPTLSLSNGKSIFCQGDTVVLSCSAANAYLWNNGATSAGLILTEGGNYSVLATDANGCSSSVGFTATMLANAAPIVSASGTTTICTGDVVTLTSTEAAGYLWSNGASTRSITVNATDKYKVAIKNANGCVGVSVGTSVVVNTRPTSIIQVVGNTNFCEGNTVTLIAPKANYYLWSNGATSQNINIGNSGVYTVKITDLNGCSSTSPSTTLTGVSAAVPTITASGLTAFCAGGSVTLTASVGSAYKWSTGAITQSIVVSASGNYTVAVTNASGCSATSAAQSVVVYAPIAPIITANGSTTVCTGGVDLAASEAQNYLWSNGATTRNITATNSGSYSVKVTDINGCKASSSTQFVNIVNIAKPTITALGATSFCDGESVTLAATAAASYLWSNGATTQVLSVKTSGDYSVTIKDYYGCSASSVITSVLVKAKPVAVVSGPSLLCSGTTAVLSAPTDAGNTYLWSNGSKTADITISSAGDYGVTVTNALGCVSTSAIKNVTLKSNPITPVLSTVGSTAICVGNSIRLSTASIAKGYLWNTGATSQYITVATEGTYAVKVIDENGCTATSASVSVSVLAAPTKPTIAAAGATNFCQGGSVVITASSADNYKWNITGSSTSSTIATVSGMYAVSVSNSIGCKSVSDSIKIVVNPLPSAILVADPSGTLNLCPGTTATITAPVASSYLWSNNAVTQNIVINKAGSYNVIITDANGCKATSQNKIVSYQSCVTPSSLNVPTVSANSALLAWTSNACVARFKIEYRKVGTIAWLTGGTSNSNTFALTGLLSSTAYKWRVATLCDTKDTIYSLAEGGFTTPSGSNLARYVPSSSSIIEDLAISLYPNPAKNAATLIIRGAIDQSTFVTLVNATGKVFWNNNRITSNTLALPVQQLAKGIYFIKVNTAQGIKVTKFIKE